MFKNYSFDRVTGRGSVEAYNVDVSVVNGLRRVLQTDVEYIAFRGEPFEQSTITIETNTGPLHNEYIAHRISLLPIHFGLDRIAEYKDGDLEFQVSVENKETTMRAVTTDDLVMYLMGEKISTRQIFPLDPITQGPVVITHLRKGEQFVAKGHAVKGTGRDHAGFCPVSLCTYRFMEAPEAAGIEEPLLRERTFAKNEYGEATAFLFQLESECGHSFHDVVLYGLDALLKNVQAVAPTVSIDPKGESADYVFINEDDTLGNLFGLCFQRFVRENKKYKGKAVTYIGTFCPHPLERKLVHRACIENGSEEDYRGFIGEELRVIIEYLLDVRNKFATFAGSALITEVDALSDDVEAEVVPVAKPMTEAEVVPVAKPMTEAEVVPVAKPMTEVAMADPEVVKEFFTSKNVSNIGPLKLPVWDMKLVNMRLADRLAMVLKDYKVSRKPHIVIYNSEVGALPWSFAQRFNIITAVEKDEVLRKIMEENVGALIMQQKAKGNISVVADRDAVKGDVDTNVFNFYGSALSADKMVAQVMETPLKSSYIVMISPKRIEPATLQPKMRSHGWHLYMKEFVLKEVKLTVWGTEASSSVSSD